MGSPAGEHIALSAGFGVRSNRGAICVRPANILNAVYVINDLICLYVPLGVKGDAEIVHCKARAVCVDHIAIG